MSLDSHEGRAPLGRDSRGGGRIGSKDIDSGGGDRIESKDIIEASLRAMARQLIRCTASECILLRRN